VSYSGGREAARTRILSAEVQACRPAALNPAFFFFAE